MTSEAVLASEQEAIQKIKAIARAISQLEGLPVDFGLAKKLSAVLDEIVHKYGY